MQALSAEAEADVRVYIFNCVEDGPAEVIMINRYERWLETNRKGHREVDCYSTELQTA